MDDYYNYEDKAYKNKLKSDSTSYERNNDLINIFFEKPNFYKSQELIEKNYPLQSYFTYSNFSVSIDDFINQYKFYSFDRDNYPFISAFITNENNIFDIIDFIPKLNKFTNKVYDKLNMRYSKDDINNKKISSMILWKIIINYLI